MATEKDLQNKLIGLLKRREIPYYKTQGGRMFMFMNGQYFPIKQQQGFPDLMIFQNGITTFIELKSDIGKLNPKQKEKFKLLEKQNFNLFILRPRDWELFKHCMKQNQDNINETLFEMSGLKNELLFAK